MWLVLIGQDSQKCYYALFWPGVKACAVFKESEVSLIPEIYIFFIEFSNEKHKKNGTTYSRSKWPYYALFSWRSMCSVLRSCIGFRIICTLYGHCCQAKCYFNIDFASNNWKKYALFNRILHGWFPRFFLHQKQTEYLSFSFARNSIHSKWNKSMNTRINLKRNG